MTIRELVTTWGFDIDDKPLKELDEKIKLVKENLKHLIEVVAAEVTAVFGLAETTADAAREASNLAQASGTTAREIQRLEFASKVAGVGAENLHMALRRLSVSAVNAAQGGSETNLIFAQLGISVFDTTGKIKNSTTLLKEMSAVFKTMPDGPLKTNAAIHLLGRSGADLIPTLNSNLKELGDEGERVGYVMTAIEVENGKKFMQMLHELEAIVMGITRGIGNKLIPVFIELMGKLKDWYTQNQELIAQNVAEYVYFMANSLKKAWEFAEGLYKAIKILADGFGGLQHVLALVVGIIAGFTTFNLVKGFMDMIPIIWDVVKALQAVIAGEAMATGGLSLLVAGAAGIAAVAGTEYLMSGSETKFNGGFGSSGPVTNKTSNRTIQQHIQSTFHITPAPGTSAQQADEIAREVNMHLQAIHRNAAVSAQTAVDR